MLFMLNTDELIIIHINLNDQINKRVVRIVYPFTNWIVFKFVNFDMIIIHVVFKLTNIVVYLYIDTTR